jgi:translation initiation factor 5
LRHKLSSFILKDNKNGKGKKDKATKKAERKARKDAENGGSANGRDGSPGDSNSDEGDDLDGDDDSGDDELTRRINDGAKDLDVADKVEWSVDMSEAAVAARAKELPSDFKRNLTLEDDDEDGGEGNAYDAFGTWILEEAKKEGGLAELENAAIGKKAQEFGIEKKHKTMTVLAQTIFTDKIALPKNTEIEERAPLLQLVSHLPVFPKLHTNHPSQMMKGSERHQKAFLGGIERFIEKHDLVTKTSVILIKLYQEDLIEEELAKSWGTKASKKYVDLATSKKIRINAKQFLEWLDEAEEESDEE